MIPNPVRTPTHGLPADAQPRGLWTFSRAVPLIGLALIVLTIAVTLAVVRDMRQHTEADYRRELASLGTVLAEQTSRHIKEVDPILRDLRRQAADPDSTLRSGALAGTPALDVLLRERLHNLTQINSLIVVSPTGAVVNWSRGMSATRISVADREFFLHFVDNDDPDLFVSRTTFSRVDGKSILFVARRLNGPDGQFQGVVAATLDIENLNAAFRAVSTSPGRSVTLLRSDGLVLLRYPDPTRQTGEWMPLESPWYGLASAAGGQYLSPGFLGLLPAMVSVHPLVDYPLVVDVSVKEVAALMAWRQQALLLAFAGAAAVCGFILLFWFITVQFRRQERQNRALRDIAAALSASERVAAEKSDLLEAILESMDQGLLMIAADDTVAVCNRRAIELLELPPELMARHPLWEEVLKYQWETSEFSRTDGELRGFIGRSALLEGPAVYDRERPNGTFLEVRTTALPDGKAVRTYTDITERKRAEQRVEFLAHHDAMTGLPNRVLLNDRLSRALGRSQRTGGPIAVLTVDLDRFKEINDMHGHGAGDEVLVQAAQRLRGAVRPGDTVARTGGDEFVVIQCDAPQPEGAIELARRLVELLSQPYDVGDKPAAIGASVGIALYPGEGDTAADLLKNSDIALYRAKGTGRGTFRLFEPAKDLAIRDGRSLEQDLRHALGTDQLRLHYQPQFKTDTNTITGFEALLRWVHPVRGDISPGVMIPIAELSRLIHELGAWVLEAACSAAVSWPVPHRVAVNLSAAQFRDGDLPGLVADVLRRTGLPARRLELEVTESLLIDSSDLALSALRSLKRMGVTIALDDFGTGYSSLSYLRLFPFDKLKIDKSFIRGLGEDPCALSIVDAILAMGRSLDMAVIAEGIETPRQLMILRGHRCAEVQGFLLGRPLSEDAVGAFIEAALAAPRRIAVPEGALP